jgi:predicted alpha/beta hydrolase family esterase
LIIASRNDNATPYSGAVSTAKFLRSPLVTLEGDGHGVAYSGNKCLENVIRDYLINDVTLTEDIVCE